MRFSLVCISSIALRSTMDQSGSQRTSFHIAIFAYRTYRESRLFENRQSTGSSPSSFVREVIIDLVATLDMMDSL